MTVKIGDKLYGKKHHGTNGRNGAKPSDGFADYGQALRESPKLPLRMVPGLSAGLQIRLSAELKIETIGDLDRYAAWNNLTRYGVFRSRPLLLDDEACNAAVAALATFGATDPVAAPTKPHQLLGDLPNMPAAALAILQRNGLFSVQDLERLADREHDGNTFRAIRSVAGIGDPLARKVHSAIGPRGPVPIANGKAPEVQAPAPTPEPPSPASGQLDYMGDEEGVRLIPVGRITASPLNPRKIFDEAKLEELAKSMRSRGVLSPILVRPLPGSGSLPGYEVIGGERRWRAAGMAGLKVIPAMVKNLDDKAALEVMVIENEQREDMTALEKARGYKALMDVGGKSAEAVAAAVGKSETTVRQLVKLLALPDVATAALVAGRLDAATAALVARIPGEATREKMALHVLAGSTWWADRTPTAKQAAGGEVLSFRQTKDLIERHCMVELKAAPFDRERVNLTPAGPCALCPKRVGNLQKQDPEGYAGSRADVCTDPECFRAKVEAQQQEDAAAARAAGNRVLTPKQSEDLFQTYDRHELRYGSDYVDLREKCHEDKEHRTYAKLIGEACAADVVVAFDPGGKLRRLLPKSKAGPALKAAGVGTGKASNRLANSEFDAKEQARRAAERKKQEAGNAAAQAAQEEVAAEAERLFAPLDRLAGEDRLCIRALAAAVLDHCWNDAQRLVAKRRGIGIEGLQALVDAPAATSRPSELLALVAELAAAREAHGWGHPHYGGDAGKEFFDGWGVDKANLMAAAAAERKDKGKKVR
jgi:ParB/RepB/Spo0J family partition protein